MSTAPAPTPDRAGDRVDRLLRDVFVDALGLDRARADDLNELSPLFGAMPELDSMAVASLLTELEDRLDIVIDDDEVEAEMLETYGALLSFARGKVG